MTKDIEDIGDFKGMCFACKFRESCASLCSLAEKYVNQDYVSGNVLEELLGQISALDGLEGGSQKRLI